MVCDAICTYSSIKLKSKRRFFICLLLLTITSICIYYFATFYYKPSSRRSNMGNKFSLISVHQRIVNDSVTQESSSPLVSHSPENKTDLSWCLDVHLDEKGTTLSCSKHKHGENWGESSKQIALGGGITSIGMTGLHKHTLREKMPFFQSLLPSFCKTATEGYHYHFYWAYDYTDPYYKEESNLKDFGDVFLVEVQKQCSIKIQVSLHMVQCTHFAKPAWAQNDAMIEAYLDNMEYFYRINDDTAMLTPGWTEAFIQTLAGYNPPNLGVVGPTHKGGNEFILTYDFTHKTHITAFGFHYPRVLTDWFADDWVTIVYRPGRSTKLAKILLQHTLQMGQRYKHDISKEKIMEPLCANSKIPMLRYTKYLETASTIPKADGTKVVAMTLFGSDTRYTLGALRNAQLMPVFFPGWILRLYVPAPNGGWPEEVLVSERILERMKLLGAEIVYVHSDLRVPLRFLSLLVADNVSVEFFVVRDADRRLSDRDYAAVFDWLSVGRYAFHCIRDLPDHVTRPVVNGLWGGRGSHIRRLLGKTMLDALHAFLESNREAAVSSFLDSALWPSVKDSCYCHDSVSCDKWPGSVSFPPISHSTDDYLGQKVDLFHVPLVLPVLRQPTAQSLCTGPLPTLKSN